MLKKSWCLIFIYCSQTYASSLSSPEPASIFNLLTNIDGMLQLQQRQIIAQLQKGGASAQTASAMCCVLSALNNPFLLTAIKFTHEKELGTSIVMELPLPADLHRYAKAFVVNYKYFLDFLHVYVYKKANLAALHLPSLLIFRGEKLLLPVERLDDLSGDELLCKIKTVLQQKMQPDFATAIQNEITAVLGW